MRMSEEEFNDIINAGLQGLPITLVVTRLTLTIHELCDELDAMGRESRKLLVKNMIRPAEYIDD